MPNVVHSEIVSLICLRRPTGLLSVPLCRVALRRKDSEALSSVDIVTEAKRRILPPKLLRYSTRFSQILGNTLTSKSLSSCLRLRLSRTAVYLRLVRGHGERLAVSIHTSFGVIGSSA